MLLYLQYYKELVKTVTHFLEPYIFYIIYFSYNLFIFIYIITWLSKVRKQTKILYSDELVSGSRITADRKFLSTNRLVQSVLSWRQPGTDEQPGGEKRA